MAPPVAPYNRWFARQGVFAFLLTGMTLCVNLVTGVVVARALGADGRGELAAAVAAMSVVAWLAAMGARQAIIYHQARHPEDAPRLVATWFALVLPFGALAIGIGEALLPHLLAAQTDAALGLARLYMAMVLGMLIADVVYATLLGDHDFLFVNVMRVAQPTAIAIAYFLLWNSGRLSVGSALLTMVVASLVDTVIGMSRLLRRHGLSRPDIRLARATLAYGLKAHGSAAAGLVNTRLDLLIVPAFLAATTVGLYAVATSVSWIVVTVSGALADLVLSAAARQEDRAIETVARSLQATLVVGAVVALVIGALAEIGVRLLYGSEFAEAADPIRILLPGCVLLAASGVLRSGLFALNRPLSAALTQLTGMAVTVVGLLLFLERGGIVAAAVVTTVSYTVIFVSALLVYRAAARVRWADLLPSSADLESLRRMASKKLEARAS